MGLSCREYVSVLGDWRKLGLVGLEVFHPSPGRLQSLFFRSLADENGLVATCGSDYHGANKKVPLSWVLENSPISCKAMDELDQSLAQTLGRLQIPPAGA